MSTSFGEKSRNNGGYHRATYVNVTKDFPKEFKKLRKKFLADSEKHNEQMQSLHEVNRQLNELPRMERMAKANMAKTVLEQTEDGKLLLQELQTKFDLS
jgi:hypothetical protein